MNKPEIIEPRDVRYFTSFDGTRICYTVYGEGERTLMLSPGLATPPIVYDYLIERFSPHLRILTWDMRGTFRSQMPARGVAGMQVEDTAEDCEALARHEGLDRFVLGGWSMGVQVSLEYYHRYASRCDGLLLINGPFGNVLEYALKLPLAGPLYDMALELVRPASGVVNAVVPFLLSRGALMRLLAAGSVVTNNYPFFQDVLKQFRTMDFALYGDMLRNLHRHSAESYLPYVRVPTLITTGTLDIMTPVSTGQRMAREIPDAELLVVERGTHYTLIEYPDQINAAAERLLRRVYPRAFERS